MMKKFFDRLLGRSPGKPEPEFLTEDQIVDLILADMSESEFLMLRQMKKPQLIRFHHTVGRYIRNEYRLWDIRNPYTETEHETSPSHPDQTSQRIIEKIWERIHAA